MTAAIRRADVAIIGGGIVGLAVAQQLKRLFPALSAIVLEKESAVAKHQSGRNSGVIHAGIYYTPGTLKARLCQEGWRALYAYCDQHGVPYKRVGKLIVALDQSEVPALQRLYERSLENGLTDVKLLQPNEYKVIEPHAAGVLALHSPSTGIVDYGEVARCYARVFREAGGEVICDFPVSKMISDPLSDYPIQLHKMNDGSYVECRYAVACAGLQADRVAALSGGSMAPRVVPFKGDYLLLKPNRRHLVNGNIYPVPNPKVPFLGVHFTPRMDGSMWLGPTATFSLKREGYSSLLDFDSKDARDALAYSGFWRLAFRNFTFGMSEMYRSARPAAQVAQLSRYVPELTAVDVEPGPCGVRAQALAPDGSLVEDFVFEVAGESGRVLHVRNAPSPAATSSLAIGRIVVERMNEEFALESLAFTS